MKYDEYSQRYSCITMERRDGILLLTLRTDDGPFQWGLGPQRELVDAFHEIGADQENRIVILTGTGNQFSGPRSDPGRTVYEQGGVELTPASLETTHWYARRLIRGLLDIEVPMIAAVNGPAMRHGELPLMCDIVLASDEATFEDTAHFHLGGHVPGDGVSVIYTMLMGLNRARYLMLTGQVLSASEAKEIGLVSEVLPQEKLLPRAWELAGRLAERSDLLLRYTRLVLTQPLRKQMSENLDYFIALETLATLDSHKRR